MSIPVVSVVVPAHNAAPFIAETLESVLAQTVREIEIVVVDDGSTDQTPERVRRFGSAVRLLRTPNQGAAKARNAGVAESRAEWIAFLDADDVWAPNKLERQLAAAGDAGASFVFTDRYNIGARGPLPERQGEIQPLHDGDVFETLLSDNFITTSTVLLRKIVFEELGGFSDDPRLPPAEDWDLWLRVAHGHRAAACRLPLVSYRHHLTGASRNTDRMNRARLLVVDRALATRRGHELSSARRRQIWAAAWLTNGWDAARHQRRTTALQSYAHSILAWPFSIRPYRETLRLLLRRS